MEIHGSKTTFNLENVLRQNILTSDYFRETCLNLNSVDEVVDEIFFSVKHVEPWMSGNARGASTAFCLLYRLFLLKPDLEQLQTIMDHPDSPYIRAVGFLYLRYVADPKDIWEWYEPYLSDEQEFYPSPTGMAVTMSSYLLDVMLGQYYFETIFPRVPKKCMDFMVTELKDRDLRTEAKGNGGCGGLDRRGADEPNRRPASVKASLSVAFSQRAPNRSNVREDGRVRDTVNQKIKNYEREKHERKQHRSESRSPERRVRHRGYSKTSPRARPSQSDKTRRDRRAPRDRRQRRPSEERRRRSRSKEGEGGRDVRDVFKETAPVGPPKQILY